MLCGCVRSDREAPTCRPPRPYLAVLRPFPRRRWLTPNVRCGRPPRIRTLHPSKDELTREFESRERRGETGLVIYGYGIAQHRLSSSTPMPMAPGIYSLPYQTALRSSTHGAPDVADYSISNMGVSVSTGPGFFVQGALYLQISEPPTLGAAVNAERLADVSTYDDTHYQVWYTSPQQDWMCARLGIPDIIRFNRSWTLRPNYELLHSGKRSPFAAVVSHPLAVPVAFPGYGGRSGKTGRRPYVHAFEHRLPSLPREWRRVTLTNGRVFLDGGIDNRLSLLNRIGGPYSPEILQRIEEVLGIGDRDMANDAEWYTESFVSGPHWHLCEGVGGSAPPAASRTQHPSLGSPTLSSPEQRLKRALDIPLGRTSSNTTRRPRYSGPPELRSRLRWDGVLDLEGSHAGAITNRRSFQVQSVLDAPCHSGSSPHRRPTLQAHERGSSAPSGFADDSQSLNQAFESASSKLTVVVGPKGSIRTYVLAVAAIKSNDRRGGVLGVESECEICVVKSVYRRLDGEFGFRGVCDYEGETPLYVTIFEPQTDPRFARYSSTTSPPRTLLSVDRGDEEQDVQHAIKAATEGKRCEASNQWVLTNFPSPGSLLKPKSVLDEKEAVGLTAGSSVLRIHVSTYLRVSDNGEERIRFRVKTRKEDRSKKADKDRTPPILAMTPPGALPTPSSICSFIEGHAPNPEIRQLSAEGAPLTDMCRAEGALGYDMGVMNRFFKLLGTIFRRPSALLPRLILKQDVTTSWNTEPYIPHALNQPPTEEGVRRASPDSPSPVELPSRLLSSLLPTRFNASASRVSLPADPLTSGVSPLKSPYAAPKRFRLAPMGCSPLRLGDNHFRWFRAVHHYTRLERSAYFPPILMARYTPYLDAGISMPMGWRDLSILVTESRGEQSEEVREQKHSVPKPQAPTTENWGVGRAWRCDGGLEILDFYLPPTSYILAIPRDHVLQGRSRGENARSDSVPAPGNTLLCGFTLHRIQVIRTPTVLHLASTLATPRPSPHAVPRNGSTKPQNTTIGRLCQSTIRKRWCELGNYVIEEGGGIGPQEPYIHSPAERSSPFLPGFHFEGIQTFNSSLTSGNGFSLVIILDLRSTLAHSGELGFPQGILPSSTWGYWHGQNTSLPLFSPVVAGLYSPHVYCRRPMPSRQRMSADPPLPFTQCLSSVNACTFPASMLTLDSGASIVASGMFSPSLPFELRMILGNLTATDDEGLAEPPSRLSLAVAIASLFPFIRARSVFHVFGISLSLGLILMFNFSETRARREQTLCSTIATPDVQLHNTRKTTSTTPIYWFERFTAIGAKVGCSSSLVRIRTPVVWTSGLIHHSWVSSQASPNMRPDRSTPSLPHNPHSEFHKCYQAQATPVTPKLESVEATATTTSPGPAPAHKSPAATSHTEKCTSKIRVSYSNKSGRLNFAPSNQVVIDCVPDDDGNEEQESSANPGARARSESSSLLTPGRKADTLVTAGVDEAVSTKHRVLSREWEKTRFLFPFPYSSQLDWKHYQPHRSPQNRDLTARASVYIEHNRYEGRGVKISDQGRSIGEHARVWTIIGDFRNRASRTGRRRARRAEGADSIAYTRMRPQHRRNEDNHAELKPRTPSTKRRRTGQTMACMALRLYRLDQTCSNARLRSSQAIDKAESRFGRTWRT
ncbi:hypothetical protein NMY22_g5802 [Coprinellus aureogranulatus]|nr:hypothetical protein NMY22_g5802 [Coprinellus aureogranulatus]